MKPLFSIIIPVRVETKYLKQTRRQLKKQTLSSFELLVITDKISQTSNPAAKRNLGAKMAKGKYLAFLDDDSYPHPNWLKNALKVFRQFPKAAAVCGPSLIPKQDSLLQKASGLVWASPLGSGGAGTYRNSIQKTRLVDDFPTVNLIVKKIDFFKIAGFDTHHWPGEDTVLCLNLTQKLKKQIIYHPSIVVFHHRRPIVWPHLKQITRYAIHRGFFAKKYPQTSLKPGFFLPSLAVLALIILPFLSFRLLLILIYIYLSILFLNTLHLIIKENNLIASLLTIPTIPLTHFYYGSLFIYGLLLKKLPFRPHQLDSSGNYQGG